MDYNCATVYILLYKYHNRRCSSAMSSTTPAFTDIGTPRFLAHSTESEVSELRLDPAVILSHGYLRLEPWRQSKSGIFAFLQF